MPEVDVLMEILDWSQSRPAWQRDALRRLVTKGELSDDDSIELTQICKSNFGLVEKVDSEPLEESHLPERGSLIEPLRLKSLTHHDGVNALANDQTLEFGPSLTVIYGPNASGKSGYTRILKKACRARGAEEILGNVVSDNAPGLPMATIHFDIGDEGNEYVWDDKNADDSRLGRISVFDRHCASVYIADKTDVAFRPLGLDLFDKLSNACEVIRTILEKERKRLTPPLGPIVPDLTEGTTVSNLVSHLTSLTEPEAIKKLATLTEEEEASLVKLRKRLKDAHSADAKKESRVLELRAKRLTSLATHTTKVASLLTDEALQGVSDARSNRDASALLSEQSRSKTFGQQSLDGSGSTTWRELWAAAERFSIAGPYSSQPFPYTEEDARCVLCQQTLSVEASTRLKAFAEFITSALQQEHEKLSLEYDKQTKVLRDLAISNSDIESSVEELKVEDLKLAEAIDTFLQSANERRDAFLNGLENDGDTLPSPKPLSAYDANDLSEQAKSLKERADAIRDGADLETKETLQADIAQLDAREALASHLPKVLSEINRLKKVAAYQLCLEETKTNAITRKSTDVTERAVTKKLAKSFVEELEALRFKHIEVELTAAGGSRGALFHKLQLKRAPGISVPNVVSEGEARCLSIASFFSELSTTSDRSAILFDDPVSSLDHNWRENVARRLASESKTRQVIVFTHDIVFLLSLIEIAKELGVDLQRQCIRRDTTGAGRAEKESPWAAMKVKDRIGRLKNLWQAAEKQHRLGNQSVYEFHAATLYGLLREAWERAVEEVLLGGVVERYRKSVQTLKAVCLSDITNEDCDELETAMTKTSRWLPGHDQAAAVNAPCPDPAELKQDIEKLESWVAGIRKRRK